MTASCTWIGLTQWETQCGGQRGYLGWNFEIRVGSVLANTTVSPHSVLWRFITRTDCNSIKEPGPLDANFRYVPLHPARGGIHASNGQPGESCWRQRNHCFKASGDVSVATSRTSVWSEVLDCFRGVSEGATVLDWDSIDIGHCEMWRR